MTTNNPEAVTVCEDRVRAEFEEWAVSGGYALDCMISGHYIYAVTSAAWNAWRASRVASAVQGEPVSLRQRLFNGWQGCSNHGCVVVDPKPGMMRTNGSCQCVVNASRSQLYMLQGRIQSVLSATQQPAEQQPAPDVAALVEALRAAEAYLSDNNLNQIGSGSILHRQMQDALATHQKRETSHE